MFKVFKQEENDFIPFGYEYFLSLPPNYNDNDEKTKMWPLILFLHGAGESHPPIEKICDQGVPKLIKAYLTNRDDHGINYDSAKFLMENFITCSPQVHEGYGWNDQVLINLIDQICQKYRIDQSRLYCTGISMGGYGTWSLAMERPDLFAAIIPICGGGDESKVSSLKALPIWNFHGDADDIVPVDESIQLIKRLNSKLCKSTIYPHVKHDSWTETYNNKEIYLWLLQHTRSK